MNDQLTSLANRVETLERNAKRWRFATVVCGTALLFVGFLVAAKPDDDIKLTASSLTTSEIVLVDDAGKQRGEFACKDGSVAIRFFSDDEGTPLSVSTTNLGTSIMLGDTKGSSAITLNVQHKMSDMMKKGSKAEPSILVHGPDVSLSPKITIGLDEQKTGRISIQNDPSKAPLFVAPTPKPAATKPVVRPLPAARP